MKKTAAEFCGKTGLCPQSSRSRSPLRVMHSLGSSSEWQSRASLSSTSSLAYGESDQTEDEGSSEASSELDRDAVLGKPSPEPFALRWDVLRSPETHLVCREQRDSNTECDRRTPTYVGLAKSGRVPTEGDLAFSRKCAELHGYVRPLLELLNGLKTGRFDKGLSTFQQSVAMDRLQRIVGILQKPHMGEKYLRTLLQVETMLKVWFPQVKPSSSGSTTLSENSITHSPPPRWHQKQLPVKKRRLSWSDSESQSPSPQCCKHTRDEEREQSPSSIPSSPMTTPNTSKKEDAVWSRQGMSISESEGRSCSNTQDCSVSSTTSTTDTCQMTEISKVTVPVHPDEQSQHGLKTGAGREPHTTEKQNT